MPVGDINPDMAGLARLYSVNSESVYLLVPIMFSRMLQLPEAARRRYDLYLM